MMLISAALVTMLAAQNVVVPPNGFRFPSERDYLGDWKDIGPGKIPPFVVKDDFNGDKLPNWPCERDEPEVLNLTLPAIEFFVFESASSIFWWDVRTATFKRTWISD